MGKNTKSILGWTNKDGSLDRRVNVGKSPLGFIVWMVGSFLWLAVSSLVKLCKRKRK